MPLGAVGTTSDSYIFPTIVNELLGTKFKPITGYAGTAQINIAIERGEVMGRGGNSWASVQTSNKSWLDEQQAHILLQVGFEKEPELPHVPHAPRSRAGRRTAGQIVKLISLPTALGYAHWVAPGVPPDAHRGAARGLCGDPEGRGVSQGGREGSAWRSARRPAPSSIRLPSR